MGVSALHPPGRRKNYSGRNLQGKFESAPPAHQVHPQAEQESVLGHFAGEDLELQLVVFDRLLKATTIKDRQLFFRKKGAPPDKILATPMADSEYQIN